LLIVVRAWAKRSRQSLSRDREFVTLLAVIPGPEFALEQEGLRFLETPYRVLPDWPGGEATVA